jgi:hypothetical protein
VADFVINEWLWSDLSGINGGQKQREAFKVVQKLPASEHRIVVIEKSRFVQKAWELCKSPDQIVGRIAALFMNNVWANSDRFLVLSADDPCEIPADLANSTKSDDHYLVRALLSVEGAILVTTDNDLHGAVNRAGLSVLFRDEFLSTYF